MDVYCVILNDKSGKMLYNKKLGLFNFFKDDFLNINNFGIYLIVC